jgi:hypothetical protein
VHDSAAYTSCTPLVNVFPCTPISAFANGSGV